MNGEIHDQHLIISEQYPNFSEIKYNLCILSTKKFRPSGVKDFGA